MFDLCMVVALGMAPTEPATDPPAIATDVPADGGEGGSETVVAAEEDSEAEEQVKLAEAQKDTETAKRELAEEKAKNAEAEATKQETDNDALKSGKLIKYGLTGGVAAAMHVPLHTARNARPGVALTGLGYIMAHPAYWADKPQHSTYCANHWSLNGSAKAGSKAADASALERAKLRMKSLFALLRVDPDLTYGEFLDSADPPRRDRVATALLRRIARLGTRNKSPAQARRRKAVDELEKATREGGLSEAMTATVAQVLGARNDLPRLRALARNAADHGVAPSRSDLRGLTAAQLEMARAIVMAKAKGETKVKTSLEDEELELSLADAEEALALEIQATVVGWKTDLAANCRAHRFLGFWVGYPFAKFKVTAPVRYGSADPTRERLSVQPIMAFGYGISPNAYFSALAGVSLGLANLKPGDDDDELVATFVVGIGGNLDLFTIFRGISK